MTARRAGRGERPDDAMLVQDQFTISNRIAGACQIDASGPVDAKSRIESL
jgi:hypothetical protein